MTAPDFTLTRDNFGRLVLRDAAGNEHAGVVPVRAFPIAAPDEGLSLLGSDGHELAWIARLADLDAAPRTLIEAALAERDFMPEIRRIVAVSTFATPSTWTVDTDRGATSLVLRGEEDIRRLPGGLLIVADTNGVQFLIRDPLQLDRHSRRLLDRFL